jgi:hypothetical protein
MNRVRYFRRELEGVSIDGWTEVHRENIPSLQEAVCVLEKDHSPTVQRATQWLADVAEMLRRKNVAYGDSAANPIRVFSRTDPVEQIKVRIDDKLSRIARGDGLLDADEDVLRDLVGYVALLAALRDKE